jgi:hypothetical protein
VAAVSCPSAPTGSSSGAGASRAWWSAAARRRSGPIACSRGWTDGRWSSSRRAAA